MPTTDERNRIKNIVKKEEERIKNIEGRLRKGIVAGLDLSINGPGICILNYNQKKIEYIDDFPNKPLEKRKYYRYIEIREWIGKITDTFLPEIIVVEEAFMSPTTANSNVPLLNVHGYIGHYLQEKGIKVFRISPSSARAFLEIKPNNKESAFNWVSVKFPELMLSNFKKENDKADSVILGLNAYNPKCTNISDKKGEVCG